jgi:hypothetical protein
MKLRPFFLTFTARSSNPLYLLMAGVIFVFKCSSLHLRRTAFCPSSGGSGRPVRTTKFNNALHNNSKTASFWGTQSPTCALQMRAPLTAKCQLTDLGFSPQRRWGFELCILWFLAVRLGRPFSTIWPSKCRQPFTQQKLHILQNTNRQGDNF